MHYITIVYIDVQLYTLMIVKYMLIMPKKVMKMGKN